MAAVRAIVRAEERCSTSLGHATKPGTSQDGRLGAIRGQISLDVTPVGVAHSGVSGVAIVMPGEADNMPTWIREHCRFNSRRAPAYLGYRRRPSLLIFWICLLATASLTGCTNPYLPYVFYIDEDGTRSLIDVCDEPLPRIEVLEVDADYDETGQVIGSYVPPAGSTSSTVVLGEETQGYTPGVDVSDGTWASLAIVYNNGETGLIVPWTDLPRGSGYTFQDELVEGSLDEIISSTRKDVPCWSDE